LTEVEVSVAASSAAAATSTFIIDPASPSSVDPPASSADPAPISSAGSLASSVVSQVSIADPAAATVVSADPTPVVVTSAAAAPTTLPVATGAPVSTVVDTSVVDPAPTVVIVTETAAPSTPSVVVVVTTTTTPTPDPAPAAAPTTTAVPVVVPPPSPETTTATVPAAAPTSTTTQNVVPVVALSSLLPTKTALGPNVITSIPVESPSSTTLRSITFSSRSTTFSGAAAAATGNGDPSTAGHSSGGRIAGITIGSLAGAAALLGLLILVFRRCFSGRRGGSGVQSPPESSVDPFEDGAFPTTAGTFEPRYGSPPMQQSYNAGRGVSPFRSSGAGAAGAAAARFRHSTSPIQEEQEIPGPSQQFHSTSPVPFSTGNENNTHDPWVPVPVYFDPRATFNGPMPGQSGSLQPQPGYGQQGGGGGPNIRQSGRGYNGGYGGGYGGGMDQARYQPGGDQF
jgi:hypothetical protein